MDFTHQDVKFTKEEAIIPKTRHGPHPATSIQVAQFTFSGKTEAPGEGEISSGPAQKATYYAFIPGLELSGLKESEKAQLVDHLNHTPCSCNCDMNVAECRNIDPECEHSVEMVQAYLRDLETAPLGLPVSNH